jgi:hypothetical protein
MLWFDAWLNHLIFFVDKVTIRALWFFPVSAISPMLQLIFIYIPTLPGIKTGQGCELSSRKF